MQLLDRYILKTVATPLLISLCVAGMLLLLEQMLRLFDFVLAEQGPVDVVWRMLANLLPHYLSLALPLGAFLGVMMAFRNLSLSSELDAMSSSGTSFWRLMQPVYGLMVALMIFDFLLVGYIQPYASYKYQQLRFDVTSGALGIRIPQGEFIDISDDATIRLGAINGETRRAEDIFLETTDRDGRKSIITAEEGSISTTSDLMQLLMRLENGRQIFLAADGTTIDKLDFDGFDLEIDLPSIEAFRLRGTEGDEATFSEILRFLNGPSARTSPKWSEYQAGFHWRLIHPLTFLLLPTLAVAMGVTGRRHASNLRPIIGVALLIIYHELLQEWGQVVAADGKLTPYISMWGLFILFASIGAILFIQSINTAGSSKVMARQGRQTIRLSAAGALADDPASSLPPIPDDVDTIETDATAVRNVEQPTGKREHDVISETASALATSPTLSK